MSQGYCRVSSATDQLNLWVSGPVQELLRLPQPSANLAWLLLQDKEFVPLLESWDQLFLENGAGWSLQHWTLPGQGIKAFNLVYGHRSCWSSSTVIKAGYELHFCLCNYCLGSSKGIIGGVGAEESLCHGCLMWQQPVRRAQRGPVPLWFQTHPVLARA